MFKKYLSLLVAAILVIGSLPNLSFMQALENFAVDAFFKIRGEREMPQNVFFVYLDEQDIQLLGGWPLTRDYWGYVIHQATKAGAKAVAIDVLFSTTDQLFGEYDKTLVAFAAESRNVILPTALTVVESGDSLHASEIIRPFPALDEVVTTGFANLGDEATIHQVPAFVDFGTERMYSFGVELARPLSTNAADFAALMPREPWLHINFSGKPESIESMSFSEFLQNLRTDTASLHLEGKLVLIAPTAPGLPIVRRTPFSNAVPAALIHLNVAQNILEQNYLRAVNWTVRVVIVLVLSFLAFLIFRMPSIRLFLLLQIAIFLCYLSVAYLTFSHAFIVVPIVYPLTGALLLSIVLFFQNESQKKMALTSRADLLQTEISKKQQQVSATEIELSTLKEHFQTQQVKSQETQKENEQRVLEKQQRLTELEKQLRDLQIYENPAIEEQTSFKISGIIHGLRSPMAEVVALVQKISDDDIPVLISGQTGTGKELLARAIHAKSQRSRKPFVAVNCGALSESLLESELFGHEKGAFTGAHALRRGRFELAHGGTIFLDEITETTPGFQARLLRVLQEGVIERLGGERTINVDVRCIAASNQDIKDLVEQGQFRADLYYRLNGFPITIPSLRERQEDIPLLARHFLNKYAYADLNFSEIALEILCAYTWPGNVRELENVVRRAGLLAKSEGKSIIQSHHLPEDFSMKRDSHESNIDYKSLEEQILEALRTFSFSRSAISDTARLLGNRDRGTITEYFRGLCFTRLLENNFDFTKTAASLAGTDDAKIVDRVRKKLESYLDNLDPTQNDTNHSQYKGLPQKYHSALDGVLDYLRKKDSDA